MAKRAQSPGQWRGASGGDLSGHLKCAYVHKCVHMCAHVRAQGVSTEVTGSLLRGK